MSQSGVSSESFLSFGLVFVSFLSLSTYRSGYFVVVGGFWTCRVWVSVIVFEISDELIIGWSIADDIIISDVFVLIY